MLYPFKPSIWESMGGKFKDSQFYRERAKTSKGTQKKTLSLRTTQMCTMDIIIKYVKTFLSRFLFCILVWAKACCTFISVIQALLLRCIPPCPVKERTSFPHQSG